MTEIECKIMGIESKSTKAGKQMWTVKTDKGNMNIFDIAILNQVQPFINGMCTLEVQEKNGFKNIKGVVGQSNSIPYGKEIEQVTITKMPGGSLKLVNPADFKDNKSTTMYTSYAKDVFIAILDRDLRHGNESDIIGKDGKTYKRTSFEIIMKEAIDLVKQASKEFE